MSDYLCERASAHAMQEEPDVCAKRFVCHHRRLPKATAAPVTSATVAYALHRQQTLGQALLTGGCRAPTYAERKGEQLCATLAHMLFRDTQRLWFAHSRLLEPGDIFSCDSNPYQLPATRDHAVALDFETSMAIARIPPEQGAPHGSR